MDKEQQRGIYKTSKSKSGKVYYNKNFYDSNLRNNKSSAAKIVDIILDILPNEICQDENRCVVDCGCAAGHWLNEFAQKGFDILGIDGPYINKRNLVIPVSKFYEHNLEEPFEINRKFTLAISFEVAEHLAEAKSDLFIDELTSLSDIVVFSAAIPFQRGDGHVNEQWPSYWIKKFESRGFKVIDCIREKIWNDNEIRFYYSQNMFLFCKNTEKNKDLLKLSLNNKPTQYDLVHPLLWEQLNTFSFMKFIDKLLKNKFFFSIARRVIKK